MMSNSLQSTYGGDLGLSRSHRLAFVSVRLCGQVVNQGVSLLLSSATNAWQNERRSLYPLQRLELSSRRHFSIVTHSSPDFSNQTQRNSPGRGIAACWLFQGKIAFPANDEEYDQKANR